MGRFGSRMALWFLLAWGLAANAGAAQPSIRFAEPVNLSLKSSSTEFEAYGQRFALELSGNERLLQKLPSTQKSALSGYRLLRGSVSGAPGSWVRLLQTSDGVEGAVWDGQELYAVTRYENVADLLTTPLAVSPKQTVVYRLSDARDALPADFCGASGTDAVSRGATALDQYKSLIGELRSTMESGEVVGASITRQIEISLIADSAFQQAEGSDPTAAMLARLNIVEGIFSEQVGLLVLAGELRLIPESSDPFTSAKPTTLLEQLAKYRSSTPAVRARGIAHLMTGKDLDGTTAGIAYVGTVCEKEKAASLSQRNYGTTISALIMAHELGHNFGATHDGEAGTACASTSAGFIMASSVTGYGTFSQCSIDTMKPVIAAASCVTAAEFADVTLESGGYNASGEGGVPFTLPFTLRSAGNIEATDTELTVTLPSSTTMSITAASASQGSCSINGNTAHCLLGGLAVGSSATVSVTALSSTGVSFTAQARATASNDRLTSNNNALVQVNVRSGVDARLALSASGTDLGVGAAFAVYADVSSVRAQPVQDVTVTLELNQPVTSASVPGGDCTVNDSSVVCVIAEVPAGSTRRVTVQSVAQSAGTLVASASVSAEGEGDLTNNAASLSGWVQAERDVELIAPATIPELSVGAVYEISYVVRSRGAQSTGDVELLLALPAALAVDGIDAGGASCTHPSSYVWRCALGALAPGEARTVSLSFHATAPTMGDIAAVAVTTDDGYLANNKSSQSLSIDHLVDLGLTLDSASAAVEDLVVDGQVAVSSNGRQAASGMLDIELPASARFTYVAIQHGDECALLADNRARCTLPELARGSMLYVDYGAEFAEPGTYPLTFTVAADGDTASANDTLTRSVQVRPYYDVSVSGSLDMGSLYGEQVRVQTFTVSADRRALATARFQATHATPALSVTAVSATAGDCHVDAQLGGICDFTNLAAYASVTVSVTYHSAEGAALAEPVVSVSTPGDVDSGNDTLTGHAETLGATDLELHVDATMGGPKATTLNFPTIEIVNGANRAQTPRLDVTLPTGVTVEAVSASEGICSGSDVLRCDFDTLEPYARASVTLSVRASADGDFMSNVKITAVNDVNSGNDSRDVKVEIGGSAVQASDGPGGGGRMEWLALAFLGLLVLRKWGQTPFASKKGQASIH